jgi:hypothetical protein
MRWTNLANSLPLYYFSHHALLGFAPTSSSPTVLKDLLLSPASADSHVSLALLVSLFLPLISRLFYSQPATPQSFSCTSSKFNSCHQHSHRPSYRRRLHIWRYPLCSQICLCRKVVSVHRRPPMGAAVSLVSCQLHLYPCTFRNNSTNPTALPLPCPQPDMDSPEPYSEDCLSMLLYVPNSINPIRQGPMMVWSVTFPSCTASSS